MGLRHRFFGSIEAVEDEFPEEPSAHLSVHADVMLALVVDEVDLVALLLPRDVDIFAQLHVALRPKDEGSTITPDAEPVWREPIHAKLIRRAVVRHERSLAE